MNVTAWRIVQARHLKSALTGDGARLYPGRWNNRGTAMIYAAGSQALAALEMLVHLDSTTQLHLYLCIPLTFEKRFCTQLTRRHLPRDWNDQPIPNSTRSLGSQWIRVATSAVLVVPSVIIRGESNYLINPAHPDFKRIKIGKPQDFSFDPRLLK